ncbi:MAG: 50S ribosomal protein L9 [Pseudomonadota bacterium]|nr:50S ribosomal protein L9 [Pseudomonadota bacterium]
MNVILMERVTNLGDLGEEVAVRNGYARNFLLPQGKAVRATEENREVFEARRSELEASAVERLSEAEQRAHQLDECTVTIVARTGDEGKLYGSVGTVEVAEALSDMGIEVRKSEVVMSEGAIRITGEYEVDIHLHADVTRGIKVVVVAE